MAPEQVFRVAKDTILLWDSTGAKIAVPCIENQGRTIVAAVVVGVLMMLVRRRWLSSHVLALIYLCSYPGMVTFVLMEWGFFCAMYIRDLCPS